MLTINKLTLGSLESLLSVSVRAHDARVDTFYPEGSWCHTYLLHPTGGIAGGDSLDISATVNADAEALVTTPAATKVYRSSGSFSS